MFRMLVILMEYSYCDFEIKTKILVYDAWEEIPRNSEGDGEGKRSDAA